MKSTKPQTAKTTAVCQYPRCGRTPTTNTKLPAVIINKEGKTEEKTGTAELPLCDYHESYGRFGLLSIIKKGEEETLVAPYEAIETFERLLAAVEWYKQKIHRKQILEMQQRKSSSGSSGSSQSSSPSEAR